MEAPVRRGVDDGGSRGSWFGGGGGRSCGANGQSGSPQKRVRDSTYPGESLLEIGSSCLGYNGKGRVKRGWLIRITGAFVERRISAVYFTCLADVEADRTALAVLRICALDLSTV